MRTERIRTDVLIIGGGVAGIQAALDCADGGVPVVLVERQPTIGGKMAKLDKTFPTVDCSACILGPKMVDVAQHPNITLYAMSEVEDISGYVGNFTVKIRKRATYVDWSLCTGCGACTEKCPSKKTPDAFNEFTGPTTAINIAFPQAIPKKAVTGKIKMGGLAVDTAAREVVMNGETVSLTYKEYELLMYLIDNRTRVVERDELLNKLWDYSADIETRTLDIHIRTLRQKLGEEGSKYIKTIRSVGYRFVIPQENDNKEN